MALIYILEDDKDVCDIEAVMLRSAGHDTKKFFDAKSFTSPPFGVYFIEFVIKLNTTC